MSNKTYKIVVKFHYYQGTFNVPKNGALKGIYGEVITFPNKEAAQAEVADLESGTYYLNQGEYARPEYTVRAI